MELMEWIKMKKENWNKIKLNVGYLTKIGTKKDLIRELKNMGSYEYVKGMNDEGELYKNIGKAKNTYYWIGMG